MININCNLKGEKMKDKVTAIDGIRSFLKEGA